MFHVLAACSSAVKCRKYRPGAFRHPLIPIDTWLDSHVLRPRCLLRCCLHGLDGRHTHGVDNVSDRAATGQVIHWLGKTLQRREGDAKGPCVSLSSNSHKQLDRHVGLVRLYLRIQATFDLLQLAC
jgi:hypothetical protein